MVYRRHDAACIKANAPARYPNASCKRVAILDGERFLRWSLTFVPSPLTKLLKERLLGRLLSIADSMSSSFSKELISAAGAIEAPKPRAAVNFAKTLTM